ncbi:hypothetical protein JOB18_042596 [Solea senegalensis]|uniref:Uncharacterized protein n=1 Tax=Solea senegalensis TaxID=28829 RepID=A0AAV6R9N5_SOLSE|nr:hypothetical protein JOB18_042596 [Solea senegalensis]
MENGPGFKHEELWLWSGPFPPPPPLSPLPPLQHRPEWCLLVVIDSQLLWDTMLFWQSYTENFKELVQEHRHDTQGNRGAAAFYCTASVGQNDGSSEESDWLIHLRWAQEEVSDWLLVVLASFLRLLVVAVSLCAEGAMLLPGFGSTTALRMVKGLRLEERR